MEIPLIIGILLILGLIYVYVMVRVASLAHFRTKLEYFRSVLREKNGGSHNGS